MTSMKTYIINKTFESITPDESTITDEWIAKERSKIIENEPKEKILQRFKDRKEAVSIRVEYDYDHNTVGLEQRENGYFISDNNREYFTESAVEALEILDQLVNENWDY